MNIVHVIVGLHIGGAELMLKRLVLHGQNDKSVTHMVISLTDLGEVGTDLKNQGVPVYSLEMKSMLSIPKTLIKMRTLFKKLKPDVVQTWMYHADFLGGIAAKNLGVKNIIWGIRTTDVSQGNSKSTIYLSKICSKLSYYIPNSIVCAGNVAMDYHKGIGYDFSKMTVIPNGYDIELLLASDEDAIDVRDQINLKPEDIVIGSVGRFNPVKNQKLFIDMASKLVQKRPNLKFMIVGRDNDRENNELMSWIKDYNLLDNVRLLGQRDDIPKYLKAMNVFCLHSKTEGFPNVLVEAMAVGLPCVSTDVGDARFILNDFGVIVPPNDIEQLTKGVEEVLDTVLNDAKNIEGLKIKLPKYINDNFSLEQVYQAYSKMWKKK